MKNANNATFILGLCMVVFYIVAAFIVVFSSYFENVEPLIKYGAGAFFLFYGIFRAARLFKQYKDEQ